MAQDDWIPAYVSPDRRDSLGRTMGEDGVREAVAQDEGVKQTLSDQMSYLRTAFKDPADAKRRLDAWAEREYADVIGDQLAGDVGMDELGPLTPEGRERTASLGRAIGDNLMDVESAREFAKDRLRTSIEAQHDADDTPVPRLSDQAQNMLGVLASASNEAERSEAWRKILNDGDTRREVTAFMAAVEGRFGADGVRAMVRASETGQTFQSPTIPAGAHAAAQGVAHAVGTVKAGEQAVAAATRMEARESQSASASVKA